jgi:hypothetical protein
MQTPCLSSRGSLTSLSSETSDASDSAEETEWTTRSQWSLYNAEMRRERAEKQQLPEVEQKAMKDLVAKAITEADSAWLRKIKVIEIEYNLRIASMERMVAMTRAEESKTIMRAKKRSDSDEL